MEFTVVFSMNAKKPRMDFKEKKEEKEEGCCICLVEEKDLPVTSCCGKTVHEACLRSAIRYYPHCPHCRDYMETVILSLIFGFLFLIILLFY